MIGLDTNVLLRYLTQDDPDQGRRATKAIEQEVEQGGRIFLSGVVLCELVWVLESAYGYDRHEVTGILERILRTSQFDFDAKDELWRAWQDYRSDGGDFSDYLIGRLGQTAGCEETVTFDGGLKRNSLFRLL